MELHLAENCIFCKIVSGKQEASVVYEDDEILAFLDINPLTSGHTLVIPKNHYVDITDIPVSLLERVSQVSKTIGIKMMSNFGADGVNIMHATGHSAGQSVFHFHVHVLPRKKGESIGFEEWWFSRAHHPSKSELDAVANKLRIT